MILVFATSNGVVKAADIATEKGKKRNMTPLATKLSWQCDQKFVFNRVINYLSFQAQYPTRTRRWRLLRACTLAVSSWSNKVWNTPTTAFESNRMADHEGRCCRNRDTTFSTPIDAYPTGAPVSFAWLLPPVLEPSRLSTHKIKQHHTQHSL